jgi:hypothetical protein
MTALSQKEKDSRRSSTFTRVEVYILDAIRRFAAAKTPPSTIKAEMESVLRSGFKIKAPKWTPYTQEVEEALKPTAEQYDAARMLTEAAFSEDPHWRTMMVAKWIAARDAAELRRQSQELERARVGILYSRVSLALAAVSSK